MTKRPWVLHPFLLAAFPTVYLYTQNFRTVSGLEALTPIAMSILATILAYAILRAFRLDGPRAALLVSAGLVLFFSFSRGVKLSERLGVGPDRVFRERLVLAIEGAGLVSVIGLIFRRPALARSLNGACNASAIALTALSAAGLVSTAWADRTSKPPRAAEPVKLTFSRTSPGRPDVYLLILDAYGRSDVLKETFGFDNSGFLDRLEAKGFVVPRSSRANYCQTTLSLASSLNLRYLDEFDGSRSADRRPIARLIADNVVFRAFRDQGYRLLTFASGFDATESFDVDLTLAPPHSLRPFPALIADQTPLWLLLGQGALREPHRLHRERILKVFDELPTATHPSDSPTFTFAHVVSPHPPFVFDADGRDISGGESAYSLNDSDGWRELPGHGGPDDYARRYRDQVAYVTARVECAVDRILASSKVPPIILIQGDHGPGSHFDSADARPNDLVERFGILNACRLPGVGRELIGDAITPVNTLRLVLNQCLGAGLEPLEDRSFYSSYRAPYAFIEVTKAVR